MFPAHDLSEAIRDQPQARVVRYKFIAFPYTRRRAGIPGLRRWNRISHTPL